MNLIQGITEKAKQQMTIILEDGSNLRLFMEYRPNQLGWFYDASWGDWEVTGQRMVTSPNMLRAFRNVLPFDLAVFSAGNVEPLNQTDFADGTCGLYLAQGADRTEINETAYSGD